MYRQRNGIRGPTGPEQANDRAGNAVVRETDRGGSGTNQPSRVSRYVRLAPAASVGGEGEDVKTDIHHGTRLAVHEYPLRRVGAARDGGEADQSNRRQTGGAGNRAGHSRCSIAASIRYAESGTDSDER
jgi:hypothetical protein